MNKLIHNSNRMSQVIAKDVLDQAFAAVYQKRQKDSANSDIGSLSLPWRSVQKSLQIDLLAAPYPLSPVAVYLSAKGRLTRWSAKDAVVLKALTLVLSVIVSQHVGKRCCHLKGHGGLKSGIRPVRNNSSQYRYVIKSDVARVYDSMDHQMVLDHVKKGVGDKRIIALIAQYMNRVEVLQGEHQLIESGIPKGCPLSPLMGALVLKSLDASISKECFYIRYRDERDYFHQNTQSTAPQGEKNASSDGTVEFQTRDGQNLYR